MNLKSFVFLVFALFLAACSDTDYATEYVGKWSYLEGSGVYSCTTSGDTDIIINKGFEVEFSSQEQNSLIFMVSSCSYIYEATEENATAQIGASCHYNFEDPVWGPVKVKTVLNPSTFVISKGGDYMSEGTATDYYLEYTGGLLFQCRLVYTATLTRSLKD